MNYPKLYYSFITYCKNTNFQERLISRNDNDIRLIEDLIYTEIHHIIPKSSGSSGGSDGIDNLVVLLPEEHLLAHKLLYKAYKHRNDMLAVRFCLNRYNNNKHIKSNLRLTKAILNGYRWIKQNSYIVRTTHGWQTPDGIKRISESRKNTMPCKDINTNESVGSLPTDHPKIISGEYVHITQGRKFTEQQLKDHSIKNSKVGNGNYSGIADDQILNYAIDMVKKSNLTWNNKLWKEYIELYKIPKSWRSFRFNNKGIYELRSRVIKVLKNEGLEFDEDKIMHPKKYKSDETKKNISNATMGKRRYTDGIKNYMLFPNDPKTKNLKTGHKNVKN